MDNLQKFFTLDVRFLLWAHGGSRRRAIAKLSRMVSRCGDGYLYVLAGTVAWIGGGENGKYFLYCGLLSYLIELSLYLLIKNTVRRSRPHGLGGLSALISPADTFSFPSGHTAAAFVFASLCAIFFPLFAPFAILCATMIGLSRIILGVHYPSDIIAGALLGIASVAVATWISGGIS